MIQFVAGIHDAPGDEIGRQEFAERVMKEFVGLAGFFHARVGRFLTRLGFVDEEETSQQKLRLRKAAVLSFRHRTLKFEKVDVTVQFEGMYRYSTPIKHPKGCHAQALHISLYFQGTVTPRES